MSAKTILLAEDDQSLNLVYTRILEKNGYRVQSYLDGKAALSAIPRGEYDAAVLDVNLGAVSGFELLALSRKVKPSAPVVVVTAFSSVEDAVRAIKAGAFDYLTKPVHEKEIVSLLRNALAIQPEEPSGYDVTGDSGAANALREALQKAAKKPVPVFLNGETGTGKELAARRIHELSAPNEPFVAVNCAAVPENLFESELFGHRKGSFTGAATDRKGKLELAGKGTIFLDEITEMPVHLQAKLLRVIQERSFEPVGGSDTRPVEARFIAASNRDPDAEIAAGRFRQDLYYRLNVYPVRLPPLRERREDIPALSERFASDAGATGLKFSQAAMELLKAYSWPGNVRELQNAVQYLALTVEGREVAAEDLPEKIFSGSEKVALGKKAATPNDEALPKLKPTEAEEREIVLSALKKAGGNQTRAAEELAITRAQLLYRMKKLGITGSVDYE